MKTQNKITRRQLELMMEERHLQLEAIALGLGRQGVWSDELYAVEKDNAESDEETLKRWEEVNTR